MKKSKFIDHTLLKAFAKEEEIKKLCEEAREFDFKSVCVNPDFVALAKKELAGSSVLVCTVVGFPLGANTIETKKFETLDAIKNGADEIDMVINISKAKDHDYDYIYEEIKALREVSLGHTLKVIIETCYLTDEEKVEVCKMAKLAKADFVKTSTGFGTGGATKEDVKLMFDTVKPELKVKASGGVKTEEDFNNMVNAGASRIGTSNGTKLVNKGE